MSSESPRIAFHFLPGDLPLSNGISGIPDLDDVLFGPMSYGLPARDATIDAASDVRPSYSWDMSQSVEDIFEDLHACCAKQAPSHPLALPERPFYPFHPAEVADTPDVVMSDAFDTPAVASMPPSAPQAFEVSDDSSSEYSDSDDDIFGSDSCYDPVDMCTPTSPEPELPQSSPVSLASYTTPQSSPSPSLASTSSPVAPTPSSAYLSERTTELEDTAMTTDFPLTEPQAAVASSSNTSSALSIAAAADQNLPPPPNSANVPSHFWPLLRLGCKRQGARVKCYKCARVTRNFADMNRHVAIHNRVECEAKCEGCPRSFARFDALKRHKNGKGDKHTGPARRAFLPVFELLENVLKKRAECDHTNREAVEDTNNQLAEMFETEFKAHVKALQKV
ncbi:hypothetical protein C8R45DRAFT_1150247 [Mycena sanguinolenta]|nr:hypothetical protein C8R45DRAFT_1150247 [Mycena sanguinolenta]